ncbi:hypothetical protein ACFY78_32260 [Streptomyces olindensis]|uniref:hypothetical protein n=1 Tax=Streptomyces olindensis TaxID=358823 RepID=UPI0036C71275
MDARTGSGAGGRAGSGSGAGGRAGSAAGVPRPSSDRDAAPTGSADSAGPTAAGRDSSGGRFGLNGASAGAGTDQGHAPRGGATAPGQADAPAGRPRFPSFGTTAAQRGESTPPPPPASARFPDTPPGVTRDRSTETAGRPYRLSTSGPSDSQAGRPSDSSGRVGGSGVSDEGSAGANRSFRLPTPRRTGAPDEKSSETTARLRPIPAEPSPTEAAESFGRPGTPGTAPVSSAGRPGAVRPGTPPRPTREPQPGAAAGADAASTPGRGIRLPAAPGRQPHTSPPAPHDPPAPRTPSAQPTPRPPSAPPASEPSPVAPDPALSWSAPLAPGGMPGATRPLVSFGEPEGYDGAARPRPLGRRGRSQAAAAAVCLVLGLGLISGAVTGSWLVGDSGGEGSRSTFTAAGGLWHTVPVDQLFPPTVQGQGAGPGGADRTWTRIAVAPDSGCKGAFDPLLRKALAPVGCERLLRATYTDATESYVTTVGLLFTTADAPGMTSLANRFRKERLDRRSDLMPLPYAAKDTPAAEFGARQRAAWTVSVLTEAPVVVYAVSGWADGRTVDDPQPAEDATESGATTAPAQAGLGYEAKGLADRVERGLRKNVRSATEQSS